jgi:sodium-dependent dicarboxylate transporter 2/3/5
MLFPIVLELARAMGLRRHESAYAKVLFLSLAWGAMVGSNASFLGSTRAPLALGILQQTTGATITFGEWFVAAAPVVGLGIPIGLLILALGFRREAVDLAAAQRMMDESVAELGPLGAHQLRVTGIILLTVCSWVFLGGRVDLAALALLGATALFAIGALRWSDLDGYVHWGIVLMYGGAIALGSAVEGSGAAEWLVTRLIDGVTISPYLAVVGLALLTVLLTEFMSNAAAVAVMLPLGLSLAASLGLSPVVIMLTCSLAAGLDFTFPFSSAPSTIVYSSGYLRMRDMLVVGTVMTVSQVILLLLVSWLYWPRIGLL